MDNNPTLPVGMGWEEYFCPDIEDQEEKSPDKEDDTATEKEEKNSASDLSDIVDSKENEGPTTV